MGFAELIGAFTRPEAPTLDSKPNFDFEDFDYFGNLSENIPNAVNATSALNESYLPGFNASRIKQQGQLDTFASELLTGGLSGAERDEIGQSNAELSALGFGGGADSSIDGLRGLRMRTDTIRGKQLQGAQLARGNIQTINSMLADPRSFLSGAQATAYSDYQFGRNADYATFNENFDISQQNKALKYQEELASDPLYNVGQFIGSETDKNIDTARSYFAGGGTGGFI